MRGGINSYKGRSAGRTTRGSRGGPPPWLIVLIAGAFVFGFFYVFQGVQIFFRTGGLGVQEATARANLLASATEARATIRGGIGGVDSNFTPAPTFTPPPECTDFRVTTDSAMVRDGPDFNANPVTSIRGGEIVCVLEQVGEWYSIDSNLETRRREIAYMHQSIIEAVNPTETPAPTQPPSLTPAESPTNAASATPFRLATVTPSSVAGASANNAGGALPTDLPIALEPTGETPQPTTQATQSPTGTPMPTVVPASPTGNFARTFAAARTQAARGTNTPAPTAQATQTSPATPSAVQTRVRPATMQQFTPTPSPTVTQPAEAGSPDSTPDGTITPTRPYLQSA